MAIGMLKYQKYQPPSMDLAPRGAIESPFHLSRSGEIPFPAYLFRNKRYFDPRNNTSITK